MDEEERVAQLVYEECALAVDKLTNGKGSIVTDKLTYDNVRDAAETLHVAANRLLADEYGRGE